LQWSQTNKFWLELLACACRAADMGAMATAAGGNIAAAGYVLACEHGALRDVTQRYFTNTLALSQVRDVGWWETTARRISNLQPRPPAIVQAAQAQQQQQQQQVKPPGNAVQQEGTQGAANQQGSGAAQQAIGVTHQAIPAGPSTAPLGSGAPHPLPLPAKPPPSAGASGPGLAQQMSASDAAALRARREDMELSHSHRVGLAGLPTSVEGFKAHPTYVLKRHISTYQVTCFA
jgi:hypothetical protein